MKKTKQRKKSKASKVKDFDSITVSQVMDKDVQSVSLKMRGRHDRDALTHRSVS